MEVESTTTYVLSHTILDIYWCEKNGGKLPFNLHKILVAMIGFLESPGLSS